MGVIEDGFRKLKLFLLINGWLKHFEWQQLCGRVNTKDAVFRALGAFGGQKRENIACN